MQTSRIKVKMSQLCCTDFSVLTFPPPAAPPLPLPTCFMCAFQKSAMKPHTSTIMTPESLGAEYTSATWNSARARPGKSSAKESTTQVRVSALWTWTSWKIKLPLNFWFRITWDSYQAQRKGITSPPWAGFFDQGSMVTTSRWMKRQIIWLTVTQEWCCRTHPMGLRGVFISRGGRSWASNIPWHKGAKQRGGFTLPQPKQGFFCRAAGLLYLPWREKKKNPPFFLL